MKEQSQIEAPNLAPPGAGLPFSQKLVLKYFVGPFIAAKTSWEDSEKTFQTTTRKILKEVESLSEAELNQKVLVPPQQGLEDSSRFWSIAMTLEHLTIVGRQMRPVIEALSNGRIPDGKADIAKLKPHGTMTTKESLWDFQKFGLEEFKQIKIGDRNSKLKFDHPWFGPMTAKQWYWLLGVHQGLHLKQIREIKIGLK